jgi:hypothetical protein
MRKGGAYHTVIQHEPQLVCASLVPCQLMKLRFGPVRCLLASPKDSAAKNCLVGHFSNPAGLSADPLYCVTCRLSVPAAGGVHNLFLELHPSRTRARGMSSIHPSHPTLTSNPTMDR